VLSPATWGVGADEVPEAGAWTSPTLVVGVPTPPTVLSEDVGMELKVLALLTAKAIQLKLMSCVKGLLSTMVKPFSLLFITIY